MKISIIYPPFFEEDKRPLLGQNRQFRFSSSKEVKIYPLIPASAATLLKQNGHDVQWLDGINDFSVTQNFDNILNNFEPELLFLETKAPIINKHWVYINELKERNPNVIVVLGGDHVSFFPEESLENSKVDFVIVGGDYDWTLLKLVEYLSKSSNEAPRGIYYWKNNEIENTGKPKFLTDLDQLPIIDRKLTKFNIYGEAYLKKPAAYILSGRGCCAANKKKAICSFCIWQHAFWNCSARLRSPENVISEIRQLVKEYKIVEIFDDNESGPIWDLDWLKRFIELLQKHKLHKKIQISCNARADLLTKEVCKLLKKGNFRLLKVGIETGSKRILKEIIQKRETVQEIKQGIKNAKDVGLVIHMTNMVGYPEETPEEAQLTLSMAKELMLYKTRAGDSLQASILVPYPGTPLWNRAKRKGWLKVSPTDYKKYDMEHVILKSNLENPFDWCHKLWKIHLHPKFILKSLITARNQPDFLLLTKGFKSLLGHLKDF